MVNITLPKITASTPTEQIQQLYSYLFQVTEQLNWALSSLESGTNKGTANELKQNSSSDTLTEKESQATFNSIKSLIIKSADIVEAYYDEINKRLVGNYVAQSDFGTYVENTTSDISANSTKIEQVYDNQQQILTDIENMEHTLIDVNAHIKSGLLYTDDQGVPIYGLEVGQRTEVDGVETFNQFARFTADKLSFYDNNGSEVAYISDKKLYITHVEIIGSFKLGRLIDTIRPSDGSIVTKYIV